jgi:RNA polymerase sigma factor (sigma-70 family)
MSSAVADEIYAPPHADYDADFSREESIEEIVARAQSGDERALEHAMSQFEPLIGSRVQRLWTALQSRLSSVEWDDVQSQVRLSFLTRLRDFQPARGVYFAHYIARMIDLDCQAWLRTQRQRETPWSQLSDRYDDESGDNSLENSTWDSAIEYSFAARNGEEVDPTAQLEQAVSLRAALATLTQAQREVVWSCCVVGKTEVAVAQELNISRSAVRNRLAGALSKLRAYFSGDESSVGEPDEIAMLAARTGRASPRGKELEHDFWIGREMMAKHEKRPDLVGIGTGKPIFLQGVFAFEATGLNKPELLSPKLSYTVPKGCVAGLRYLRVGVQCDSLVCISTFVNGDLHRLIPVAANSTVHISLAIVEPLIAGSQIEIHVASDSPGTAIIDAGCLQMPA